MRDILIVGFTVAILATPPAYAAIVVDHSPDHGGGSTSDTDFLAGSLSSSQQSADDFMILNPATIHQIVWWGNYGGTTPSASGLFRVRVYTASGSTGLPGDLLSESTIDNPLRIATGLVISEGTGGSTPEYIFQANFQTAILLASTTPYWLEIAELGDTTGRFRWEWSSAEQNGFAFLPPGNAQWQSASFGKDLASQLSTTPEPGTITLMILAIGLTGMRTKHNLR